MRTLFGFDIIESPIIPPDFYLITNWENPSSEAIADYLDGWMIEGKLYVHPVLAMKIKLHAEDNGLFIGENRG
jgi:hypothetical protein